MTAEILLGKPVAERIYEQVGQSVDALVRASKRAKLQVTLIGSSPDDLAYESSLERASLAHGIDFESVRFAEDVPQDVVESQIMRANADDSVDAIMVFRPIPRHLDEMRLMNLIDPAKDVDGASASSIAGIFCNLDEGFAPATAQSCIELLDFYGVEIAGKRVAVIGRSLVIGKPISALLMDRDATVTVCHSKSAQVEEICRQCDIVVVSAGKPNGFGPEFFTEGQTVIDVGINELDDGTICGDVDFEAVSKKVSKITPVPRGVGSVTTSVLLKHVCQSALGRI